MKRNLFPLCLMLFTLLSCHNDNGYDNDNGIYSKEKFERSVLIYISGENGLSEFIQDELYEIRKGSISLSQNALIVYVDDNNSQHRPYIMRMKDGVAMDSTVLDNDPYSSDPNTIKFILNYVSTNYPAKEYGLVLWGHASGWLKEDSIATHETQAKMPRKAYGIDNGKNGNSNTGKWINLPTLAKTLNDWGHHLKFIFADCCQFQCIESAFELRKVADYIIGSPAEVPGQGAPYETVTPTLFLPISSLYFCLVDSYFKQVIPTMLVFSNPFGIDTYDLRTPLSVIKTDELEPLATATNEALHAIYSTNGNQMPDLLNKEIIYYKGTTFHSYDRIMYDMNDFILQYADATTYAKWKQAFDRAVVYKVNAKEGWLTNLQVDYNVFRKDASGNPTWLTDERYGGVSMYFQQNRPSCENYQKSQQYIRNMTWYYAAKLYDFGW